MERIEWGKIHQHDYSGNCLYCGCHNCTDEESIENRRIALDEIEQARKNKNHKRHSYLINKWRTYAINYRFVD